MKSDRIVSRGHSRPCQYSKAMCLITMTCSDNVVVSMKRFSYCLLVLIEVGIYSIVILQTIECSLSFLNLDAEGILVKDVLSHLKDWDMITQTENI